MSKLRTHAVFAAAVVIPLLLMAINVWLDFAAGPPPQELSAGVRRALFWLPAIVALLAFQALPFSSWRWRLGLSAAFAGAMACLLFAAYVGGAQVLTSRHP